MTRGAKVWSAEPSSREDGPSDVVGRLPRLVVVSYFAHAPFEPRGMRTRAILDGLRPGWAVDLVAGPAGSATDPKFPQVGRSGARRALNLAHSSILLDRFELWSWRCFRSWSPIADGALLIGYPFSAISYAGRVLSSKGIPYVVDIGDPWVLTAHKPLVRGLGRIRGRAAETNLWDGASGAIVTTTRQADALSATFPSLPVLVRPNGLDVTEPSEEETERWRSRRDSPSVLTIAHFGEVSPMKVSIAPFLEALADSGRWQRIELHQFGSDSTGELVDQSAAQVIFHRPRPWSEIVDIAVRYDVALVIANRDRTTLPSKAVAYLGLPIPRLAVVQELASHSLADYVADKPGWLTLSVDAPDIAAQIHDHVSRRWAWAELRPPESESWDHVTDAVLGFLGSVLFPRPC